MVENVTTEKKRIKGGVGPVWIQAVGLFAVWLLLSGKFDAFHMGAGVVSVAFLLWLDRKLGLADLGEGDLPIRVHPVKTLSYVPWLLWQMLLSSIDVAKIVLNPSMPLNPTLVSFGSKQPHTVARVLLGNSITLTPGTLTLDIQGDRYLVHALSDGTRNSLLSGDMQRRIARLFLADASKPVFDVVIETPSGGRRG